MTALVIFARPDDETMMCGGPLALLAIEGWNVHYICATRDQGGEYGHPAHPLTHPGAASAMAALGERGPLFYTMQAAYPGHSRPRLANKDDQAHLLLDVSPVKVRKTNAARRHRTQHAMFIRNLSKDLGCPVSLEEVVILEESLHPVYPPVLVDEIITDELMQSLEK